MCKSFEIESAMMFSDTFVCWECRETSLLIRFHSNHRDTISWSYFSTGFNEALYIHPSSLDLSIKDRMCDHGSSC